MPQPAWQLCPQPALSADLLAVAGNPLLAQLLAQRGLVTGAQAEAFLNPACYRPAPPTDLPDVDRAVARLNRAIAQRELIGVWGDFDVDGQTSTTLLVEALQNLGGRVTPYIPNRLTESHGIKLPALRQKLNDGVSLLLTCDTGIAEHDALNFARAAGVDVIITDHHDLPETLPPSLAAINPKRLPPGHPLADLPGVGVAFKLMQALYQSCGRADEAASLLDLAALGIVADVARQTADTRHLLQLGLAALQSTARVGLRALLEAANLKTSRLTADHIAFWLAPRLNALGRLGDANLAVELLTTANLVRARTLALQLEGLNDRRKLLVDRLVAQALGQLAETPALAEYHALVLAGSDWHPGVIGIAASRLVDRFGKPVILIAHRPDGAARGSARSVPGCDIHQAIKTQADLLAGFGGHPAAAGLSIVPENINAFRRGVSAALAGCAAAAPPALTLDAMVELDQISINLLATIERLAPFGAGNPPVKLGCAGLRLVSESPFGATGAHRRLLVENDAGARQEVIWWRGATERLPQGRFDLAFSLGPDDFRGGGVQVEWLACREWQPAPVGRQIEWVDWRQAADVAAKIGALPAKIIWAEGDAGSGLPAVARHQLRPAANLVIWTAPPGQDILALAVAAVRPQQIFVVAQPSPLDLLPAFTRHLQGLVKFALSHKEGELLLPELAAALGQRQTTARLGLDWLAAQGKIVITVAEGEVVVAQAANRPVDAPAAAALTEVLTTALAETAAYRAFFRRAGLSTLEQMVE